MSLLEKKVGDFFLEINVISGKEKKLFLWKILTFVMGFFFLKCLTYEAFIPSYKKNLLKIGFCCSSLIHSAILLFEVNNILRIVFFLKLFIVSSRALEIYKIYKMARLFTVQLF